MGVPGCYPGCGRFESFPRRSDPLVPCSHAPGVSVGEGCQPFKLEVGGSIPLGSTRDWQWTAAILRCTIKVATQIGDASTVSSHQWVVGETVRFFARKAHTGSHSPSRRQFLDHPWRPSIRSVASPGTRRFKSCRWLPDHREHPGQREHVGALDTGSRSDSVPVSVTHSMAVEVETYFASGAGSPGSNPGGGIRSSAVVSVICQYTVQAPAVFRPHPVPVAQSGQSTGLRSRVSHVRIVPGTSSQTK